MLEMIEDKPIRLPIDSLVVETGGMKSRRRDVDRVSLHRRLAAGFGLPRESIRSEYGMCEMLSQCYTLGGETFHAPPWVRVKVVDPDRPHLEVERGRPGLLAVFDLANGHSVSPILTEDIVREEAAGFEVLGRLGQADLRGCNFLFEQSV